MDMRHADEAGREFGQDRGQRDRNESLDGEGGAQATEGEIIEGQVYRKEAEAEAYSGRIMGEEGKARGAAGKQSRAGKKRDAEHREHAAGDDALRVVKK
ncbi:UNVERIFIED_ORG: hypothetical protein GGD47_003295 [Rhizobium etli]